MNPHDSNAPRAGSPVTVWSPWGPQKVSLAKKRQERLAHGSESASTARKSDKPSRRS